MGLCKQKEKWGNEERDWSEKKKLHKKNQGKESKKTKQGGGGKGDHLNTNPTTPLANPGEKRETKRRLNLKEMSGEIKERNRNTSLS